MRGFALLLRVVALMVLVLVLLVLLLVLMLMLVLVLVLLWRERWWRNVDGWRQARG